MPTILLIRHATNDFVKSGRLPGRTRGIHLNDEGRRQADALSAALAKRSPDAIYSSPLERAIETALPLARTLSLPIRVLPALADIDNGDLTGREIKALSEDPATRDLWRTVTERPSRAAFPNGESMLDMQRRAVGAIEQIIAAHPDLSLPPESNAAQPESPKMRPQTIAVISHADVIKAILAHYLDMPFDSFQKIVIAPASVSTLSVATDAESCRRVAVLSVNYTVPNEG
ncbi:MAG: histidine phosphatase family protein [Anaerolineae bacterium]|nr:histidine phosphatase family protein [Thermoflexales bacterium]MDW8396266.1 histidine phosphatase family protein [Anaerolineae bacterium]